MAAISDYQRENKQKKTYKPKNTPKLDSNKAKNNTTQAFGSGKNYGALLKKDPPKAQTPPKNDPPKKDPPKAETTPKKDPPKTPSNPPNRVSKFLGGQTVQQMLDKRGKMTDKEKAAFADKKSRGLLNAQGQTLAQQRAARQAAINAALAEKRKKDKEKRTQSGSKWASGQLKGL